MTVPGVGPLATWTGGGSPMRRCGVGLCWGLFLGLGVSACGADPPTGSDRERGPGFVECDLPTEFLWAQVGRDAIVSLDEPVWVRADQSTPDYLDPATRVIGVVAETLSWAIPHNVLWHHEIVNFDVAGPRSPRLAVTYCPLTGSALVFDRRSIGGATLGVSGILFMNNLVLYDRRNPEDTLWPQMMAEARCGSRTGTSLTQFPFVEMRWDEWVALHPTTRVLAGPEEQGFDPDFFDYSNLGYPYGTYEEDPRFFVGGLMPPPDTRRFAKERVLGLPPNSGDPGIAFPFDVLTALEGDFQVEGFTYEGESAVVLWSDAARGGSAYRPRTDEGVPVSLHATATGFEDAATGSRWTLDGRAVSGPRAGDRLQPLERAFTAFWGAWAAFHPGTRLWSG